jgi:sporulation protein YlmC with PRC-barrel domain
VKNGHGEDLGAIREVLVDPATGKVVQLILETGPAIGFKKPIGLSWDMLTFAGEEIHVNLEKDFIQHIPAYDETHQIEIK